MPSDKDLFKQYMLRFSLVNQSHLELLSQIEKDCEERNISRNKLLLECVEFYYRKRNEDEHQFRAKEYIDAQIRDVSEKIRKELYQEFMQAVLGYVIQKDNSVQMQSKDMDGDKKDLQDYGAEEENSIMDDPNIMENIMKWS